jgi:hypothetical protein
VCVLLCKKKIKQETIHGNMLASSDVNYCRIMIDQTKFDNTYNNYTYKSPVEAPLADFKTNKSVRLEQKHLEDFSKLHEEAEDLKSHTEINPVILLVHASATSILWIVIIATSIATYLFRNHLTQVYKSVTKSPIEEDNSIPLQEIPRFHEEGRMSEEGLNQFRKSSRTERSPSRGEERNQSKEIEKKIETVLREIKEDMAAIVEESRVRRKELPAAREKEGEQERENMLKSSEVRKESTREKEKRVERRKKARTHSEIVPEQEDHQIEAKKKIKARKWIRK